VEVAKALGGSFKLVTLALKTVREMTQLPKETQKNGDTNKSKRKNKYAKHKPRLNMHTQKLSRPNRAVSTGPGICAHGKLPMYSVKYHGPLQLLSPTSLMTSTTKQMRPNGRGTCF